MKNINLIFNWSHQWIKNNVYGMFSPLKEYIVKKKNGMSHPYELNPAIL